MPHIVKRRKCFSGSWSLRGRPHCITETQSVSLSASMLVVYQERGSASEVASSSYHGRLCVEGLLHNGSPHTRHTVPRGAIRSSVGVAASGRCMSFGEMGAKRKSGWSCTSVKQTTRRMGFWKGQPVWAGWQKKKRRPSCLVWSFDYHPHFEHHPWFEQRPKLVKLDQTHA